MRIYAKKYHRLDPFMVSLIMALEIKLKLCGLMTSPILSEIWLERNS